jgi:hypothetical protein
LRAFPAKAERLFAGLLSLPFRLSRIENFKLSLLRKLRLEDELNAITLARSNIGSVAVI